MLTNRPLLRSWWRGITLFMTRYTWTLSTVEARPCEGAAWPLAATGRFGFWVLEVKGMVLRLPQIQRRISGQLIYCALHADRMGPSPPLTPDNWSRAGWSGETNNPSRDIRRWRVLYPGSGDRSQV